MISKVFLTTLCGLLPFSTLQAASESVTYGQSAAQKAEKIERDAKGRKVVTKYYQGNSSTVSLYDEKDRLVEQRFYDAEGKAALGSGGYHKIEQEYCSYGFQSRWSYFGVDGKPCLTFGGYATLIEIFHDERAHHSERHYYGVDGKPCVNTSRGYASIIYKKLPQGKAFEERCYGVDGKACRNTEGYATMIYYTNDSNRTIKTCYFDTLGQPCMNTRRGYARVEYEVGENNQYTSERHYNAENQLIVDTSGREEKDAQGNIIKEFNSDTRITTLNKYNAQNQILQKSFLDALGRPGLGPELAALIQYSYNDAGQCVETNYYGLDGQLCNNSNGFARYSKTYNKAGKTTEIAYYDKDAALVVTYCNYAKQTIEYDEHNRVIKNSYYDETGQLAFGSEGYASRVYRYDEQGNVIELAFYDTKGNLHAPTGRGARTCSQYNDKGLKVESRVYGVNGKAVVNLYGGVRTEYSHNSQGHIVHIKHFDAQDCLVYEVMDHYAATGYKILHPEGFAVEHKVYDQQGHIIKHSFFANNFSPFPNKDGFTLIYNNYDEQGNLIAVNSYNSTIKWKILDEPNREQEFAVRIGQNPYDPQRMPVRIERYHYDQKGVLAPNQYGFSKMVLLYHEEDKLLELRFFNAEGEPCDCTQGYARAIMHFDAGGGYDYTQYLNAKGQEVP